MFATQKSRICFGKLMHAHNTSDDHQSRGCRLPSQPLSLTPFPALKLLPPSFMCNCYTQIIKMKITALKLDKKYKIKHTWLLSLMLFKTKIWVCICICWSYWSLIGIAVLHRFHGFMFSPQMTFSSS